MRAWIFALVFVSACTTAPPPTPSQTAVELTVTYDDHNVEKLTVTGTVGSTARKFGPFSVKAKDLDSGEAVGLLFDELDAGDAMACVSTLDDEDKLLASGCTLLTIRAREIMPARLVLMNLPAQH